MAWHNYPDGQFMPAMEMTVVEKDVAARMKEHYKGQRSMIIGRVAITEPLQERTNCQYRNKCWLGCPLVLISVHSHLHYLRQEKQEILQFVRGV